MSRVVLMYGSKVFHLIERGCAIHNLSNYFPVFKCSVFLGKTITKKIMILHVLSPLLMPNLVDFLREDRANSGLFVQWKMGKRRLGQQLGQK